MSHFFRADVIACIEHCQRCTAVLWVGHVLESGGIEDLHDARRSGPRRDLFPARNAFSVINTRRFTHWVRTIQEDFAFEVAESRQYFFRSLPWHGENNNVR